ncbi:hypothetical protein SSCG_05978 [Streptomyces clavuligerus]|nr:hypothetical protein SSCG_05978 [Streptomyces clavuligerus]
MSLRPGRIPRAGQAPGTDTGDRSRERAPSGLRAGSGQGSGQGFGPAGTGPAT